MAAQSSWQSEMQGFTQDADQATNEAAIHFKWKTTST